MANSIFLCSLNGWMVLTFKRIPWTWISVVSLGSRVCQPKFEPFFLTEKLSKVGDTRILRWGLGIFWKSACPNVAMVSQDWLEAAGPNCNSIAILRSWLYLGICCALCTINTQKQLGDTSLSWYFWEPTSWCPFSCVSNRHQLVPSDPAPKIHAHLVAGQPPILKTFNVKPTSKINPQKRIFQTSPNHRLHSLTQDGWDDFSPRIPWTPSALLKSWAATAEKTVPPWRKHLAGEFVRVDKNQGFGCFFVSKADFTP